MLNNVNPLYRVLIRAVIAFLGATVASIQAADNYGGEAWVTAVLAGLGVAVVLAAAELGTSINPTVGLGKPDEQADNV